MKGRTAAQHARQAYRDSEGRYAEVNRCYCCDKRVGVDYCSDARTDTIDSAGNNWGDVALCLCQRCAKGLETLPDNTAFLVACGDLPRPWARKQKGVQV